MRNKGVIWIWKILTIFSKGALLVSTCFASPTMSLCESPNDHLKWTMVWPNVEWHELGLHLFYNHWENVPTYATEFFLQAMHKWRDRSLMSAKTWSRLCIYACVVDPNTLAFRSATEGSQPVDTCLHCFQARDMRGCLLPDGNCFRCNGDTDPSLWGRGKGVYACHFKGFSRQIDRDGWEVGGAAIVWSGLVWFGLV